MGTSEIKFVLLSMALSGTTTTIDMLSQHPDTYTHREVFAAKGVGSKIKPEFLDNFAVGERLTAPVEFTKKLLDFTPGPKCVGFKMWRTQSKEAADYILKEPSIHKIIHRWQNSLARYSSSKLLKKTRVAQVRTRHSEQKREQPKISFDRDEFLRVAKRNDKNFEKLEAMAVGPILKTTFSGVVQNGVSEIFECLGLEPFETKFRLGAVNTKSTIDRFREEDHEAIKKTLEDIGHTDWISE